MAYVGTPTRLESARDTLASIIQGEAGGEGLRGMQAVGQVISNRAAQNYGGYGSDLVSQATARMQFQGQSLSRISPQAYQVADQALAGQLPDVVGSGAVNYANPGDSSARWARNLNSDNSFQLGNHYFTDNTKGIPYAGPSGAPMSSTDPLQYTGPNGFQTAGVPGVTTSAGSEITGFKSSADGSTADVELGFPGDTSGSGGTGINASSFSSANVSGDSAAGSFGLGGLTGGGQTVGAGNSGVGGTSVASASSSAGGSFTVPQAIDTQTRGAASDTSSLNKQSAANTDSLNKTSTANTKAATDKAQSLYNAATGSLSDYFVRLVFIVVGLIALAAALLMFKPVQNAAASVVPAGRAIKAAKAVKAAVPG